MTRLHPHHPAKHKLWDRIDRCRIPESPKRGHCYPFKYHGTQLEEEHLTLFAVPSPLAFLHVLSPCLCFVWLLVSMLLFNIRDRNFGWVNVEEVRRTSRNGNRSPFRSSPVARCDPAKSCESVNPEEQEEEERTIGRHWWDVLTIVFVYLTHVLMWHSGVGFFFYIKWN